LALVSKFWPLAAHATRTDGTSVSELMKVVASLRERLRTRRKALFITVLPIEYNAALAHLRDVRENVDSLGTVYGTGFFEGDPEVGIWEVAITLVGLRNSRFAPAFEHLLEILKPEIVMVVGIAEGIGIPPGDVVVATTNYALDASGIRQRGAFELTHRLHQRSLSEATSGRWRERIKDTSMSFGQVHFGAVASAPNLLSQANPHHTLAVDSDSYGFVSVVGRKSSADAIVVCGIAQELRKSSNSSSRELAAAQSAAAFAFQVIARLREPETTQRVSTASEQLSRRYLCGVQICRVRSISEVNWQIDHERAPGWHVLIGENGSGKTTVLRAVALAMLTAREGDALLQDWSQWPSSSADEATISVSLSTPGSPAIIGRSVNFRRISGNGAQSAQTVLTGGEGRDAPPDVFCVGYGPFRRFSGGDPEYEKQLTSWPRLMRHITLFSERAALSESLSWLKDLRFKQLEEHPDSGLLDSVKTFINESELLPQGTRWTAVSSDDVTFEDGNGIEVSITEMSDGFRSVLSLVLDLIRHLAAAHGATNVFSRTTPSLVIAPGIMLIDEVDVHLHPTWQHQIGHWFRKHFPEIQFIVATHSILICQAADSVFLLPRPGQNETGRMLEGLELERLRYGNVLDAYGTGIFGRGVERSDESRMLLTRLGQLNVKEMDEDLSPEEQQEQEHLRAVLPTAGATSGLSGAEPRG